MTPHGSAPRRSALPLVATPLLCAMVGAALLASCGSRERPVPKTRLVTSGFGARADLPLEQRDPVILNDVAYTVFTSSKPTVVRTKCVPNPSDEDFRDCLISLPPTADRWAIVETARLRPTDEITAEEKTEGKDRMRFALLRERGRVPMKKPVTVPERASKQLVAYLAPDLAERDITAPVEDLPRDAELRFAFGVEEPAWFVDSAPVDFVVRARRGNDEKELYRQRLDPFRRKEDRGWHNATVSLASYGPGPLELVFSSRAAEVDDHRLSLPVWGDPTIVAPGPPPGRPRRIVLVSLDTLRAKSMSAYGYALETTPAFAKLVKQGTLFERAFTAFSNTLGSHMSMFTGLYPASHKVSAKHPRLDKELPTLAERLRGAGYETGAFTEDALLSADAGFRRGFARYYENKSIGDGAGDAEGTFKNALEWMKQQGDLPFFAFVHTYEVHSPYNPPEYTQQLLAEDTDAKGAAQQNRRLYEREIRHLDRLLDDLMNGLNELGPREELLLVVTADHGEEFYEHKSATHTQLYDEVMHVPLFMRWPGTIPADRQVQQAVSLVDVVPTILDLAGLPHIEHTDGMSLVPLLDGKSFDRDLVFGQSPKQKISGKGARYVARSAAAKCIVAGDEEPVECYDLVADPDETKPLAPETNPALGALYQQALEYKRLAQAGGDTGDKPIASEHVDEDTREKLKVLGYVE